MNVTVVQVVNPLQKLKYVQQHVACFLRNNYWPAKKKEGKKCLKLFISHNSTFEMKREGQAKIIDKNIRLKY